MEEGKRFKPNLGVFGVAPEDPGFIYVFEDHQRYKICNTGEPMN
jgi:hypothetical protein